MDEEGPFRTARPADRRVVAARPEPAYRQPDEPKVATSSQQPAATHRSIKEKKPSRRFKLPLIILGVVLLGVIAWLVVSGMDSKSTAPAINKSEYQAVFFTNGQVYFGKLTPVNSEYMKLTDIFYLQTSSTTDTGANPQQTSSDSPQLIKLGNEIHGPEDQMIVSKDQVLFYENLKPDGKVSQSIETYKKSH